MKNRKIISNLILILFFLLVGAAALLTKVFQNPMKNGSQVIEQVRLFTNNELSTINKLTLKNKSGEYTFERNPKNQISPWHMTSPRDISANSVFIDKLFTSLSFTKVKKVFPEEKINYSNFSLDKPTSTLTLVDQEGKTTTIMVGLMNTIDNSTYVKISGRPGFFHVDAPAISLENATILDLVESQIISIDLEIIQTFRIYRGNKKSNPSLEIKKKNDGWIDRDNIALSADKIDDYLGELSNLKSTFIIDKPTDAQKRQVASLSRNASFIVSVEDNKGNVIDYYISSLIRDLSDLDLKNEEYFVVTISNNNTSYVVKKVFYNLFNKKADSLKATAPAAAPAAP
jgi:hypothetical protein